LLISIMVNNESDEGYNTEMQPKHGARKELGHSIAMGQNSNELPIIENEDDEIQFGEQYDGIVNVSKLEDVCKLKYEYSLLSSSVVPHWRNSYKGLKQNIAMESTNGSPAVVELPCTPEFLPFWDDEHFCRKLNKYEIFSNLDKDEKMILKFCIEKLATDFLRQATMEIAEKLKAQLKIQDFLSVYISNDKIKGSLFTERKQILQIEEL
ncbi:hypothetical protein T4B_7681, partial [Trichinella pseudospiralis]